jgi:hypothetical protein
MLDETVAKRNDIFRRENLVNRGAHNA